jgi:hypothetical protein
VRVLLDECVDWRLAREIVGHDVKTARQMGWATIKNGELLTLAANQFDVFVTVDRNLCFQQNLVSRHCASGENESTCRPQAAGAKAVGGNRVRATGHRQIR